MTSCARYGPADSRLPLYLLPAWGVELAVALTTTPRRLDTVDRDWVSLAFHGARAVTECPRRHDWSVARRFARMPDYFARRQGSAKGSGQQRASV